MTRLTLTSSTEMMDNRIQAELIAPQKKFEALQTADGHSLLFAIDTGGTFRAIVEQSGTSAAGWQPFDLSDARIAKDFPAAARATCTNFGVGQNPATRTIGMGMVVGTSSGDVLYLSLGNSDSDTSWAKGPTWTRMDFDAAGDRPSSLRIAGIFFCEASDKTEHIVVDILRDPGNGDEITRYFVRPGPGSRPHWVRHDLPVDIQADRYDSCVGRVNDGKVDPSIQVDGVYTAGHAGSGAQLVYVPIENIYGDAAPLPVRLALPGGAVADTVAASRNPDLSTDLYVTAGKTLYRFAADGQSDGATGAALVDSDLFTGMRKLSAMEHDGIVTLWGLNGSDQVVSLRCQKAEVATPGAWSVPVPVLSGMEAMSPYLNNQDGGSVIFAAGGGKLDRVTQATRSAAKLWQTEQIALPTPPDATSMQFTSYTTVVQASDPQGLPVPKADLRLSAAKRTPAYVNGLYYVLDTTPVHVRTDGTGTLTVVEATDSLTGTALTVAAGPDTPLTADPTKGPVAKLSALDTPDKLKAATITGADGKTRPLVAASVSDDDLKTVAQSMSGLGQSYAAMTPGKGHATLAAALAAPSAHGIGDDIRMAAGDLFNWLKSGVEAAIDFVRNAATGVWDFVVKIAGKVYRAVLDTAEAIVGAAEWLFDKIKTAVKDLIAFVKFLFEWDDIRRTKEVLHTLSKRFLEHQVDEITAIKGAFDGKMNAFRQQVADWAGLGDISQLGTVATQPAANSARNPLHDQNAGAQHLSHHFQNNAHRISFKNAPPKPSIGQKLIDDLHKAIEDEGKIVHDFVDEVAALAKDFSHLSTEDVLKRLLGILSEAVLGSVQVVVDAVLSVLADLFGAAIALLDTKIHIPVLSDILNDIGVPDMSFLDVLCWIGGAAFTIVYKIAEGRAPFPDDPDTKAIINADSYADLQRVFGLTHAEPLHAAPVALPGELQVAVFKLGHATGSAFTLLSAFTSGFEAAETEDDNPFSTLSTVVAILSAVPPGAADALVPDDPVKAEWVGWVSKATLAVRLGSKAIFAVTPLKEANGRSNGAIVDALLVAPALFCTCWHLSDLSELPADSNRSAAILGEVAAVAAMFTRVMYAVAVNDDDPESRAAAIAVMEVGIVTGAGLQMAQTLTYKG
jgi:hypothetical protein